MLATFCRPLGRLGWERQDRVFWAAAAAFGLAVLLPGIVFGWMPQGRVVTAVLVAIALIALASVLLMRRPFKAAFAIAIALAMVRLYPGDEARTQTLRSFFGVHKSTIRPMKRIVC